jgi:ribonucleoside-triphosphate reductase
MQSGARFLADLVHYRTYSSTLPSGRKETRQETINRCMQMHLDKFPHEADNIVKAFSIVHAGMAVPSMRTLQFSGRSVERENARAYNCSAHPIKRFKDFGDCLYILCCGAGFGFSVQQMFISQLPVIEWGRDELFVIEDSKEGWADSMIKLLENPLVRFDYSLIRPYGSPLSSGGWASGFEPLRQCHELTRMILDKHTGKRLSSLAVADIICHIADAIVVAGTRRSSLICLFDADDNDMLTAKTGSWWEHSAHRARMNVSAVIHRKDPYVEQKARAVLSSCFASNAGEPGMFFTNDFEYLLNPCAEISLRAFCNLTEINVAACQDEQSFLNAVWAATYIGTLQASYTDFNYIHSDWKKYAEEEALLGVSFTGQAMNWPLLSPTTLQAASYLALTTNALTAQRIGINMAHRIGTTKPSGSTSAWLGDRYGVTSGIHAAHDSRFVRRVRVDINNPMGQYLIDNFPLGEAESGEILELDKFNPSNIVVAIPVEMQGAITRQQETAVQLMERARHIHDHWIKPTHRQGPNTHNVSLTVSYKKEEEAEVAHWMLKNRDSYAGMALLPFSDHCYTQAPFESVSGDVFERYTQKFSAMNINLSEINWAGHADQRQGDSACGGSGGCEVT